MGMRIIAGQFKGRKLFAPKDPEVRPTSDRLREAFFAIIGEKIREAKFLDLFAGSGAVGIEAKSRGADTVVFVEISAAAVKNIQRNCELVGMEAAILRCDVIEALSRDRLRGTFDVIFCDPPYDYAEITVVLEKIAEQKLLVQDGMVIYESSARKQPPVVKALKIVRQKSLGDARLTFYQLP